MGLPRLLLVTRHTPLSWEDGAGAYTHDLMTHAAEHGWEVHVLWLSPHPHIQWQGVWRLPEAWSPQIRLHAPGAWSFRRHLVFPAIYWQPRLARAKFRIKSALQALRLWPRQPSPTSAKLAAQPARPFEPWMRPPSAAELAATSRVLRRIRPDTVFANFAWMAPVFDLPECRGARRFCIAHDVAWRKAVELARSADPREGYVTAKQETDWLRRSDTILAITESDAAEFRRLVPERTVVTVPWARPVAATGPLQSNDSRILFVGSGNSLNREGLEWFLAEIWPAVRSAAPEVVLEVCGSVDRVVTARPAGVIFTGTIPNLAAAYARATCAVLPMLGGTGLNIKLVEAAAAGCACVTTPVALRGAPELAPGCVVAESARDFAAAVAALLSNPARRATLQAAAREAAARFYSPQRCYSPLSEALAAPRA